MDSAQERSSGLAGRGPTPAEETPTRAEGRWRRTRRWAITIVATGASTYALDAVATGAGVLLAASHVLRGLDHWLLLVFLAATYVVWGAGLRVNLQANWTLLERTGTSTNAFSKAAYDLTKATSRSPRTRRIAAAAGYVGTELLKEAPYYAGAFGTVLFTDSVSSTDALIFLGGANLAAAAYEYGLARGTRVFLRLRSAGRRPSEPTVAAELARAPRRGAAAPPRTRRGPRCARRSRARSAPPPRWRRPPPRTADRGPRPAMPARTGSPRGARAVVEKARKISPLPWWATEPVRARPRPARRASRVSSAELRGASVASTTMQLPAGAGGPAGSPPSRRPTGTPSTRRSLRSPKFASTRAPTVAPLATIRLELPIPPFQPKQTIPVPAPTAPCSTGDPIAAVAAASARPASAASTCTTRASLSQLSSHSATTGIATVLDADPRIGRHGRRHRAVEHAAHRHGRGQVDRRLQQAPLPDSPANRSSRRRR